MRSPRTATAVAEPAARERRAVLVGGPARLSDLHGAPPQRRAVGRRWATASRGWCVSGRWPSPHCGAGARRLGVWDWSCACKATAGILWKETVRASAAKMHMDAWYITRCASGPGAQSWQWWECALSLRLFLRLRVSELSLLTGTSTRRSETGWSLQPLKSVRMFTRAAKLWQRLTNSRRLFRMMRTLEHSCSATSSDPAARAPAGGSRPG